MINSEQLQEIMPYCPKTRLGEYAYCLSVTMRRSQIHTVNRAAAYLGQISWESGDLVYWQELSDGRAYEGRKDLGNVSEGDGPRYKGRGPIQLTGRANYHAAGFAIGRPLEKKPDLVLVPLIGFEVAAWYWTSRGLNPRADEWDLEKVTRKINGGLNHHDRRVSRCVRARGVLCRTAVL